MSKPKMLPGSISISRPIGDVPTYVVIRVNDQLSDTVVIYCEIPLASFAEALFARADCPCSFELYGSMAGRKREHKDVLVTRGIPAAEKLKRSDPAYEDKLRAILEKVAAKDLVGGWELVRLSDYSNHHQWVGKNKVRMIAVRWVDATDEDLAAAMQKNDERANRT